MHSSRKPLTRIEGRKRLKVSGLTIAWRGTPKVGDWIAYIVTGPKTKRLILADQVSERTVKRLVSRARSLSKREVEKLAKGRKYPRRIKAISRGAADLSPAACGPVDQAAGHDRQETSRLSASPEQVTLMHGLGHENGHPGKELLPSRVSSAIAQWSPEGRYLFSGLSQTIESQKRLEAKLQALERDNQQFREEIAYLFDGDSEPPSIFDAGWFRSALVLLVFAIVVTVTLPYLLDLWQGSPPPSTAAHSGGI
jgi:hypothetical protein